MLEKYASARMRPRIGWKASLSESQATTDLDVNGGMRHEWEWGKMPWASNLLAMCTCMHGSSLVLAAFFFEYRLSFLLT